MVRVELMTLGLLGHVPPTLQPDDSAYYSGSTNNRFVPSSPRACYRAYERYNFLSVRVGIAISTTTETRTEKRRN